MAMSELIAEYKVLQAEMDEVGRGVCFACKLLNYDEIVFIEPNKNFIIQDLEKIIENVSKELNITIKFRKKKKMSYYLY